MDISAKVWSKYHNFNLSIVLLFSNIYMSIYCWLRKIEIGENCDFYGKTFFHRVEESVIYIGSHTRFRSIQGSNLIGINHGCYISTLAKGARINIGNYCGFSGVVIGCFTSITIGNNVMCGANTLITDSDWHPKDTRSGLAKPVVIKDNVWIGYSVTILKGITIGENSVIGANSVVTKSIPDNVIAAGNPCKVISMLK